MFKLNSIIASVLSLGIICSGSVFASGAVQKDSEKPPVVTEERTKQLTNRLNSQLNKFYQFSSGWNKNLMKEFKEVGFMITQADAQTFIGQIRNDRVKVFGTLEKIKNLLSRKNLRNELVIIKDITKTAKLLLKI